MKIKYSIIILIFYVVAISLTGCATKQIPEPYTNALQDIKNGDYDSASRYLDLTIKDFPNSDYFITSHFLKSLIVCGTVLNNADFISQLADGYENGMVFFKHGEDKERKRLDGFVDYIINENAKFKEISAKEIDYALKNFDPTKLELAGVITPELQGLTESPLSFFASVGTPVPTQTEFDTEYKNYKMDTISYKIQSVIKKDGTVDLALYYDSLLWLSCANSMEKSIKKELASKIIAVTENDKYNKIRLDTLDYMKNEGL
ncbi:MAG: hypothetical protein M0T74_11955 [Desulfitobacterium hafniense]|nr:hypothetical protein [Desulfitobacterium hafniense]